MTVVVHRAVGRVDVVPRRPAAPLLGLEIVLVLAISLGQSAVYSILRIIERLTRPVAAGPADLDAEPLGDPGPALAGPELSAGADRLRAGAGAARPLPAQPATRRPAGRSASTGRRLGFDLGFGIVIAAGIGIPGLGLYLGARALGPQHPGAGVRAGRQSGGPSRC